jgi:very-short-patch-repair endonuclease
MRKLDVTLRERSRRLRRDQTDAERKLWITLRSSQLLSAKFRRQHVIGPFIVDFCCPACRLVVEVDGGQHALQKEADQVRHDFLVRQGYRVIRFWNHEVLQNTERVLESIVDVVCNPPSSVSIDESE